MTDRKTKWRETTFKNGEMVKIELLIDSNVKQIVKTVNKISSISKAKEEMLKREFNLSEVR